MNGYMIVDSNSLGYAAQSTNVLTANGIETQAIYQTLKMLKKAREDNPEYSKVLMLWDGHAQFRYDLWPDYKGKRSDTDEKVQVKEKYHAAKPFIQQALTHLGLDQVVAHQYEADDLAGYFCRKLQAAGKDVLLLTGDKDWIQLVNGKTKWYDPRDKVERKCSKATFKEVTGVDTPAQFLECKALIGDTSDNIPPVGGIGEKAAPLVMEHFGSVKGLIDAYRRGNNELTKEALPDELSRYRKKLNELCGPNFKAFSRNYRLMNLNDSSRDETIRTSAVVTRGQRDFDAFADLCMELSFLSITRDLKSWERTFK